MTARPPTPPRGPASVSDTRREDVALTNRRLALDAAARWATGNERRNRYDVIRAAEQFAAYLDGPEPEPADEWQEPSVWPNAQDAPATDLGTSVSCPEHTVASPGGTLIPAPQLGCRDCGDRRKPLPDPTTARRG